MKAIVVTNDKSLIWQEVDDPQVKDGEVLIEIYATAINRADLLQKAGVYPPPAGSPEWMGLEVSGVIKKLSPKAKAESSWQIGDQVCALLGGGGYAEYVAIDHRLVLPIPKGLSMVEVADWIQMKTSNGGIRLKDINFENKLSVTSSNGDLYLSLLGSAQEFQIDCKTSNGECRVPTGTQSSKSVDLKTSNGHVNIDFSE